MRNRFVQLLNAISKITMKGWTTRHQPGWVWELELRVTRVAIFGVGLD